MKLKLPKTYLYIAVNTQSYLIKVQSQIVSSFYFKIALFTVKLPWGLYCYSCWQKTDFIPGLPLFTESNAQNTTKWSLEIIECILEMYSWSCNIIRNTKKHTTSLDWEKRWLLYQSLSCTDWIFMVVLATYLTEAGQKNNKILWLLWFILVNVKINTLCLCSSTSETMAVLHGEIDSLCEHSGAASLFLCLFYPLPSKSKYTE